MQHYVIRPVGQRQVERQLVADAGRGARVLLVHEDGRRVADHGGVHGARERRRRRAVRLVLVEQPVLDGVPARVHPAHQFHLRQARGAPLDEDLLALFELLEAVGVQDLHQLGGAEGRIGGVAVSARIGPAAVGHGFGEPIAEWVAFVDRGRGGHHVEIVVAAVVAFDPLDAHRVGDDAPVGLVGQFHDQRRAADHDGGQVFPVHAGIREVVRGHSLVALFERHDVRGVEDVVARVGGVPAAGDDPRRRDLVSAGHEPGKCPCGGLSPGAGRVLLVVGPEPAAARDGCPRTRRCEARITVVDDSGCTHGGRAEAQYVVGAVDVEEHRVCGRARQAVAIKAQLQGPVDPVRESEAAPVRDGARAPRLEEVVVAHELDLAVAVDDDVKARVDGQDVVAQVQPHGVPRDTHGVAGSLIHRVVGDAALPAAEDV